MPKQKPTLARYREAADHVEIEESIIRTIKHLVHYVDNSSRKIPFTEPSTRERDIRMMAKFGSEYIDKIVARDRHIPYSWSENIRLNFTKKMLEPTEDIENVAMVLKANIKLRDEEVDSGHLKYIGPPVGKL